MTTVPYVIEMFLYFDVQRFMFLAAARDICLLDSALCKKLEDQHTESY
jgi:hypothetical protein